MADHALPAVHFEIVGLSANATATVLLLVHGHGSTVTTVAPRLDLYHPGLANDGCRHNTVSERTSSLCQTRVFAITSTDFPNFHLITSSTVSNTGSEEGSGLGQSDSAVKRHQLRSTALSATFVAGHYTSGKE